MRGQFVSYSSLSIRDGSISHDGPAENFVVPDGTEYISYETFTNLGRVVHISVPDSVRNIRDYAFKTCFNLVTVDLPSEVDHFGVSVFQMCKNLVSVDLPKGVRVIDPGMFIWCESLKRISVPDSVTRIDGNAFKTCRSLREIHIDPEQIGLLPEEQRITAAITFMNEAVAGNASEQHDVMNSFIREKALLIGETAIERNEKAAVSYMITHDLIDGDHVPDMLVKANGAHRTEIAAMLLECCRSVRENKTEDPFDWDPFA